jgi:hopanoid biosynthesis associated protein HpnK
MVGAPATADAVDRARQLRSLKVGLHVVLTDGRPVLPPSRVPNLVDESGRFRGNIVSASVRIFVDPMVRQQVSDEIDAQFKVFVATGLQLDHVDCHQHCHLHPTIAHLILDIGQRYGMKALRIPSEPLRVLRLVEKHTSSRLSLVTATCAAYLRARVLRRRLVVPDRVFGLAWSGAMTESRVAGLLAHLPDGLTEIYSHPATSNSFSGATPGYCYVDELAALVVPGIVSAASGHGIRLIGYSDVAANSDAIIA